MLITSSLLCKAQGCRLLCLNLSSSGMYGSPQWSTTSISLALHFHCTLASPDVSLPLHPSIHPKLELLLQTLNKIKSVKRCRDSRRAKTHTHTSGGSRNLERATGKAGNGKRDGSRNGNGKRERERETETGTGN